MITGDDPFCCAACARTIGPSFNPGSEGCVAADGSSAPKDKAAASATYRVVREATCDAPFPALRSCRLAFRIRFPGLFKAAEGGENFTTRNVAREDKSTDVLTTQPFRSSSLDQTMAHGTGIAFPRSELRKRSDIPLWLALALWLARGVVSAEQLDQQQVNSSGGGSSFTSVTWVGQTFVAGVSGALSRLEVSLFCFLCAGGNPDIIVEVRTTSGGLPTSTVLATTTLRDFPVVRQRSIRRCSPRRRFSPQARPTPSPSAASPRARRVPTPPVSARRPRRIRTAIASARPTPG